LSSFRGTNHTISVGIAKSFGDSAINAGSVTKRNNFEVDLGGSFGQLEAGGYSKVPEMTLAFSRTLDSLTTEKYAYGCELYMSAPTKDSLSEIYILNQLTISLKTRATFRTGFRTGLTPNSPKLAFFGAITFSGSFK
jgi:hypothetical protein